MSVSFLPPPLFDAALFITAAFNTLPLSHVFEHAKLRMNIEGRKEGRKEGREDGDDSTEVGRVLPSPDTLQSYLVRRRGGRTGRARPGKGNTLSTSKREGGRENVKTGNTSRSQRQSQGWNRRGRTKKMILVSQRRLIPDPPPEWPKIAGD